MADLGILSIDVENTATSYSVPSDAPGLLKKFNKDMDEFTRYLKKEYPGEDPLGKNWDW